MRRLTNLNYLAALAMAFAAITFVSCFRDEVVRVPDVGVDSNTICFGANVGWADEDEITRGAESRRTLNEGTISSEEGSVSLPLIVTQEDGIRTATPVAETRGSKVTSGTQVERMRVWATWAKDGNESNYFTSANADDGTVADPEQGVDFVRNSSGIYYSTPTFMWPGDGSFTFTAVANLPENIGDAFTASLNANGTAPEKFTYRVPAVAEDQHDIMIAKATGVSGSQGASVPLNFQHIMAAVNFKVGSVVAGTIKSITLKGIYNKAEYNFTSNEWVNRYIEDGGVFEANIGGDRVVETNNALNGTQLNSDTATFMMIPQQPTTGAEIEIMFEDGLTGKTHQLRANIQGNVWNMNTTTNYMVNIDGDYNLQIVPLDNLLDSHYIITKVEISSEYPNWTLGVFDTTGDDLNDMISWIDPNDTLITIEEESKVNPMAKQGFWTDKVVELKNNEYIPTGDSARGGTTITGSTSVSNKVIYVFVPENVSGEDRNITLALYQSGNISTMKTLTLTQHPVKWLDPGDGNPDNFWGCELLIEGGQVDWGFCWDNLLIEFTTATGGASNLPPGRINKIKSAMESAGISLDELYNTNNFICMTQTQKSTWLFQIDLGRAGNIDVAESDTDGHFNTLDIYGFQGISSLNSLVDFIGSWNNMGKKEIEYTATSQGTLDDIKNSLDYAVLYAMKRNRFDLQILQNEGTTMYVPTIEPKDINWYLPAKDQFNILMRSNWGQQFSVGGDLFWTSTAYLVDDGDNSKSYAFINGAETIAYRKDKYLTMALRRKTQTTDIVVKPEDVVIPDVGNNGPEYGDGGDTDNNTGGNIGGNT